MVPRPHTFSGVSQRRGAGCLYLSTTAPPAPLAQVVTSPTTLPTGEVGRLPGQPDVARKAPSGFAAASGARCPLGVVAGAVLRASERLGKAPAMNRALASSPFQG